jgi:hypothetical protein
MGASFSHPQSSMAIDVNVVNTGYLLDSESFLRFIDARESNEFSEYNNYVDLLREYSEDNSSYIVTKQVTTDEVHKSVVTHYLQYDQAILIIDYWAEIDANNPFEETLENILDSVEINVNAVANLDLNSSGLENVSQNDNFVIKLPYYWEIGQSRSEYSFVDSYTSPDEHVIIQTIVYDDGLKMSDRVAGELVLNLLSEQYAKDISIISDTFLPGPQEKLSWVSKNSDYKGVTIFETRGTSLLVFTVMWDNEFSEYYGETIDTIIKENQNDYGVSG